MSADLLLHGLRRFLIPAAIALGPAAAAAEDGLSGTYLAARSAELQGDVAAAARYYGRAARLDPINPNLLERAMIYAVQAGDVPAALPHAEALEKLAPDNRNVPLVLAAEEIRAGAFGNAIARLDAAGERLGGLVHALLKGWSASVDDLAAADLSFAMPSETGTLKVFGAYHRALARAVAGDLEGAATGVEALETDFLAGDRRALQARAEILAASGRQQRALALLDEALDRGVDDAGLAGLRDRIRAGEAIRFTLVPDATAGVAEALYTVALVLSAGEEEQGYAIVLARLALHLRPDHPEALMLVADLMEMRGQYEVAIAALEKVPATAPQFLRAEIMRASALAASGRQEEAIGVLTGLTRAYPEAQGPATALATLLRRAERFAEAAEAYDRAIALVPEVQRRHWVLFYERGIVHERSGQWDKAEADFRNALALEPDQPLVLNYLGYSLVELGRNLGEAEGMIRRAVSQRPEDGFITDSLAWVLFRLGRFEEAVEPMERAVELEPTDPILNDHLGDILWKVGRKLEARFQWKRALSFDPQEKDRTRILRKLEVGLDAVLEEEAAAAREPVATDAGDGG